MNNDDIITLDYGSGGKKSRFLVEYVIAPILSNTILNTLTDAAIIDIPGKIAFTSDCYVVTPRFFPGGNIGSLSVHGTLNDLAVMGSIPRYLAVGLIIEEGFSIAELKQVLNGIAIAAADNNVLVVTGDTKVVQKGTCDGIYICTTGIGERFFEPSPDISRIVDGDLVIINGNIGDHGLAVMRAREGLKFDAEIKSDSQAIFPLVKALEPYQDGIHFMRDPTRGGLASVLNEIARSCNLGIKLNEENLPINKSTNALAEILGLDLLYIANEGKCIFVVDRTAGDKIIEVLKSHQQGLESAIIGEVLAKPQGKVIMNNISGGTRIIDMPSGEILPRIC